MPNTVYPTPENILSEEFLSKYKGKQPNWGFNGLGYVVYKRCVTVETPVLCEDMIWRPAGSLKVGDKLIGFEEGSLIRRKYGLNGRPRHIVSATVTHNKIEKANVVKITLENGDILYSTPDHSWLVNTAYGLEWLEAKDLIKNKADFVKYSDVWVQDTSYEAGYLAAAFDGEGSLDRRRALQFAQVDNIMLKNVREYLDKRGFKYKIAKKSPPKKDSKVSFQPTKPCYQLSIYGNSQVMRFLGEIRPKRLLEKYMKTVDPMALRRRGSGSTYIKVVSVEDAGEKEIAVMSTSSKTHFTGGYPSHNTYSRRIDGADRTEEWWETVARCIRGAQKIGAKYTQEEAEKLFDHVFNLRCNFAGRALWQLNTPTVDKLGGNSLVNCFSYDTEIITDKGIKKIGDLSGQTVKVMTEYGKYVDAPIKSYGEQNLFEIKLTRKGTYRTIYATGGHRWFRQPERGGDERLSYGKIECITTELRNGHKLISTYGQGVKGIGGPSPIGIAHGLVFGDGSVSSNIARIRLCGAKNKELLKYFPLLGTSEYEGDIIVNGLPRYYKEKPELNMDKPYLYGWLAGYFAADGCISKKGKATLYSADLSNIKFVRDVCVRLGIQYSDIHVQARIGIGQDKPSNLYNITFNSNDLGEEFFLISQHKKNFLANKYYPKSEWRVVSVKETNRLETVYCAEVPETHSFVLEGNILTGNCLFTNIRDYHDFLFLFENSMLGGGVGFSIKREDVHELPRVKDNVVVTHENTKDADFIVPDSREGWSELLRKVFKSYFETGKSFSYSTILIRGAGEKIHTFGGIASGPGILIEGVDDICKVLNGRVGKKIRSIDALDICNILGKIVVSGNVRRSAEIAIGDVDDIAFLKAKRWDTGEIPNWRAMSNNSVYCTDVDHLQGAFWDGYNGDGEPYGLINVRLARKYGRLGEVNPDPSVDGFNPCAEIPLSDKEICNLAELYLNNITSKEQMAECAKLLYKYQKAVCGMKYYHDETTEIVNKNMKIGLGVTGICQNDKARKENWYDFTYTELKKYDKEWSEKNKKNTSIRLTTIKPSGTLSLLAGCTPGVHPAYSKFFIRRIRMASNDPLVEYCREKGFHVEYQLSFDGGEDKNTVVVEFPCSTGSDAIVAKDMTAIKQLELVKEMQKNWADNAVSVTVYYKKEEIPEIKEWLKHNYHDSIKSVSFLLHKDHGFKQAPYEEITEEQYNKIKKGIKDITIITKDVTMSETDNSLECSSGACPIR